MNSILGLAVNAFVCVCACVVLIVAAIISNIQLAILGMLLVIASLLVEISNNLNKHLKNSKE